MPVVTAAFFSAVSTALGLVWCDSVGGGLFLGGPLLHRRDVGLAIEVEGGVHERDVRERLREVSELAPSRRIPFLGEQAEVAAQVEQALKDLLCLVDTSLQREVVREPERAGQERTLTRRQAVDASDFLVVRVAVDEPIPEELALGDGADHAGVVGG